MKILSAITASVLIAALAATSLPVSAAQSQATDTSADGIVLDCDAAAAELAVLNTNRDSIVPLITRNDDNSARSIFGTISDSKITNPQEAEAALKRISSLLGVNDYGQELTFDSCTQNADSTEYVFRQTYHGLRVEGCFVTVVTANDSNRSECVTSSFIKDLTVDTDAAISAAEAKYFIKQTGNADITEPELIVRVSENGIASLAWIACTGTNAVYVDAVSGAVTMGSAVRGSTAYFSGASNELVKYDFSIDYTKGSNSEPYVMRDPGRNIWIGKDFGLNDNYVRNSYEQNGNKQCYFQDSVMNVQWLNENVHKIDNPYYDFNADAYKQKRIAVGVMHQVERAYDFYNNTLGWKGTDGKGSPLYVNPCFQKTISSFASIYGNYLAFKETSSSDGANRTISEACALDCVIHEYTHRVSIARVGWAEAGEYGETAILNEAYSDIMGEYGSGADWLIARDWWDSKTNHCLRNARRDSVPQNNNNQMYSYTNASDMSTVECHTGSTILSHCAYRMSKYGIPDAKAQKAWFRSMEFIPKGSGTNSAKFKDVRNAVIYAMRLVTNESNAKRNEYEAKTRMAFNAVGVYETSCKMGDVNLDKKADTKDTALITKYFNGTADLSPLQLSLADVTYDGVIMRDDYYKIENAIKNKKTGSL